MTAYEAIHKDAAWLDLSPRGKVRLTGEDRVRLLHAMCTNNIEHLAKHAGLYAFFLSAQGRILADANIYNLGDSLFLDTEPELGQKLRDHLDRYIIADDATAEDETDRWAVVSIEGPRSLDNTRALGLPVPEQPLGVETLDAGFVARAGSCWPEGVRVFLPEAEKEGFEQRMRASLLPELNAEEARIVRLENGTPRYGEDISERYLAQETGLLRALHFAKGCYLGQEIVERIRSRAQVHRHLKAIHIDGEIAPAAGSKLLWNGNNAGEITAAAFSAYFKRVVGLAYVRTEAVESRPELLVADTEPSMRVHLA
ncbi:MAG: folate-binding protein YgfZ [Acidobacteriaceae bacterium]|nr:folate-binding protein YgfZ [Acidobacteriaceae bacterium]